MSASSQIVSAIVSNFIVLIQFKHEEPEIPNFKRKFNFNDNSGASKFLNVHVQVEFNLFFKICFRKEQHVQRKAR